MTEKECFEVAMDGGIPEHTPCFWSSAQLGFSSVIGNIPAIGTQSGYDWWGVHWTATENTFGMFTPTVGYGPVLKDITKWKEEVKFPDISGIDWEAAAARDTAGWDRSRAVDFYGIGNGLFERVHFLMGYEEAMYAIMEEPEAVAELVMAIAEFYCELIRKIGEYYKPDYLTLLDDYAYKDGGMISPEQFRNIFAPALKKIVETTEEGGMKFIMHCCGQEQVFIDEMYKIGIRRMEPCQPCNDVVGMKKKHPDMAFMGGLDLQGCLDLENVTEEQIRAEVRRCLNEYGKEIGSYVVYGCSISMYDPNAYAPGGRMYTVIDETLKAAAER
jgi:hypothetical protein